MFHLNISGEAISNVQLFRHSRSGYVYIMSERQPKNRFRVSAVDIMSFVVTDLRGDWQVSDRSEIQYRRCYLEALLNLPPGEVEMQVCDECLQWFDASYGEPCCKHRRDQGSPGQVIRG